MNGRVYDPAIGRFLSPDPVLADASFSQSWNAYSYALNSPLSYTDPSGLTLVGGCPPSGGGFGPSSVMATSGRFSVRLVIGGYFSFGLPTYTPRSPMIYINDPNGAGGRRRGESLENQTSLVSRWNLRLTLLSFVVSGQPTSHPVGIGEEQSPADRPLRDLGLIRQSAAQPRQSDELLPDGSEYSPNRRGWHYYTAGPNKVCSASQQCTAEQIRDQLSRFAVPGQDPSTPVEHRGIYFASDPRTGIPAVPVQTSIGSDGLIIVNVTLPGHIFHAEKITRSAEQNAEGA